jgi:para-aminobenzoate synthetase component 1
MNKTCSLFYLSSKRKFLFCEDPISAYIYYRDFRINLLDGKKETFPIADFLEQLRQLKLSYYSLKPFVIHLFYELGYKMMSQEELIPSNKPLALAIEYAHSSYHSEIPVESMEEKIELEAKEYPRFKSYQKKFDKVRQHLIDGDCYQVNLTSQFFFKFQKDIRPQDFICNLWADKESIGAYAHCTYIHSLDRLFLSNSPECLFQINHKKDELELYTMPIKGTVKVARQKDLKNAWEELKNSPKEQGELYMITDLLRNDLARIEKNSSTVVKKKLPLVVPGIVHQYSIIKTLLSYKANLLQVLEGVFPGGSITGAPKKRVMKIISQSEDNYRGFYCGSTVLFHLSLKAASINIRSAEVDFTSQEMQYGSGGGVTLLSEKKAEFDETYIKMQSFLSLLGTV